jgi:hypothetical protein
VTAEVPSLKPVAVALGAAVALAFGVYVFTRLERVESTEEMVDRLVRESLRRGT